MKLWFDLFIVLSVVYNQCITGECKPISKLCYYITYSITLFGDGSEMRMWP